jgi:hypothetical protein
VNRQTVPGIDNNTQRELVLMKRSKVMAVFGNIRGSGVVEQLLSEFGWNTTNISCPAQTGNCRFGDAEGHGVPHFIGDMVCGSYRNASAICGHCYSSTSPATLSWDNSQITLTVEENPNRPSTKPERFKRIVGGDCLEATSA